ncbi:MAG: hypothetical protein ABI190_04685 [Casimicrobiaceae bacterium]
MEIARAVHLLGAVVWVGGMFFANFALRPFVGTLPAAQRLPLLVAVLGRFLAWAGVAAVALFASGGWMMRAAGGMAQLAPAVHVMIALAIAMLAVYVYVIAGPFRALRAATARADLPAAGSAMARVRVWVAANLAIGLVTVVIGAFAR